MSLREILDFRLLDLENYQITIFNLGSVCVILFGTFFGLKIIKKAIDSPNTGLQFDGGRGHSVFLFINYIVWVISIAACLQAIGIQLTLFLAGSAALLVGLGLGIQQIFNDIVSGMFLLFEGNVEIGDVMEVDGMICKVMEIKLRTSKVKTRDDIMVIVPNHKFINEKVINWSHQHKITRFRVAIGVSYKSDPDHVCEVLLGVMNDNKDIVKSTEKTPIVRLVGFGDSSLDFEMLFYSSDTFGIENILSDMRLEAFRRFKTAGVEIPFPQRDMHFRSTDIDFSKFNTTKI